MITILSQKYFNQVVEHCAAAGDSSLTELLSKLEYLSDYGEEETDCLIAEDRGSEWGFDFAVYRMLNGARDPQPWINGGLILHDGGTWGIHT